MLTEDYIMRMISQALAVIIAALGLKRRGKFQEALQTFDQAVEGLVGLNASLANQLDDSMLLERLTFMGNLDVERVLVLADIYREEADVYRSLSQPANHRFAAQRSLRLYLEAALANPSSLVPEIIEKIEGLRHMTDIPSTPIETRLALQDYIERLLASSDDFLAANGLSRPALQADFHSLESLGLL